ncbi:hypothetical protein EON68_04065 [archaeon]|nr:MAG: hypothetical protein EON68_04065 [archaeon]
MLGYTFGVEARKYAALFAHGRRRGRHAGGSDGGGGDTSYPRRNAMLLYPQAFHVVPPPYMRPPL